MMNNISFLTDADIPAAFVIERASHAFPWSEETLRSNQGELYYNLKLEVAGKLSAYAITQVVAEEATLFNIAVLPAMQGGGLGRSLLSTVIQQLKELGVMTLWLEVRESNNKAIALYESLGFCEVGVRQNYYPSDKGREDARIMALVL